MDKKIEASLGNLLNETEFYLNAFTKRAEIDEQYAEALLRLANKEDEFEKEMHRGIATSSLHTAWIELREDSKRIASAAHTSATQLKTKVIEPISAFRDGKQRVRKRIKEELRNVVSEHAEYKSSVARYQKAYEKSCEAFKAQQHISAGETSPVLSTEIAAPASTSSLKYPFDIVSSVTTTYLRDNNPPPNQSGAAVRVNDALKESKKQFTTLINRLGGDQNTSVKSPPDPSMSLPTPGAPSHNVAKLVKAKKEAELADSDYRKGIYHLETLRLQRERVHRSAAQSVLEFVAELAFLLKEVAEQYCNLTRWCAASTSAFVNHTLDAIMAIRPEQDAAEYSAKLPVDSALEPIVYYENAYVGRCRTLLFGVPLAFHASSDSPSQAPRIVKLCIKGIEDRIEAFPSYAEGIYRISPVQRHIQKLVLDCEKDENSFYFDAETDIHSIAGLLKLYLRQLPTPLCGISMAERVEMTKSLLSGSSTAVTDVQSSLSKRIRRIPPIHQATLKAVLSHIKQILNHEVSTKMNLANLAIVLTPCIFDGEKDAPLEMRMEKDKAPEQDLILEFMVEHFDELFSQLPVHDLRQRSSSAPSTPGQISHLDAEEEFPMRVKSPTYVNLSHHSQTTSQSQLAGQVEPSRYSPVEYSTSSKKSTSAKRRTSGTGHAATPSAILTPHQDTYARTPELLSQLEAKPSIPAEDSLSIYEAFTQSERAQFPPPLEGRSSSVSSLPPGASLAK